MEIVVLLIAAFIYLILKKYVDYILAIFFSLIPDLFLPFIAIFIAVSIINYVIHRGDAG